MIGWNNTKEALTQLESLLCCKICGKMVSDPCSLQTCDHHFCRGCIEKVVDTDAKCPECGSFTWVRDMKTNRQLANTAALCLQLRSLFGDDEEEGGSSKQQGQRNPEALKSCSSTLDEWEETEEIVDEEANTFIFPSPNSDSMVHGHEVDDECEVSHHNGSQTICNTKELEPDDQGSTCDLNCAEVNASPVFKRAQPLKTYSRAAMRNFGMLRKTKQSDQEVMEGLGRTACITAESRKLEPCDTDEETVNQLSEECENNSDKGRPLTRGRNNQVNTCSTTKKKLKKGSFASGNVLRRSPGIYEASDEIHVESDHVREVFEEMDANLDGREMETNTLPDHPNISLLSAKDSFEETDVTMEKEANFESERNISRFFTRVKSKEFKVPHSSGKSEPAARDILHGTPRTRAQKRKAPGTNLQHIFEAPGDNTHVKETSVAETKKSKSRQGTLENFIKCPVIQVEKAVTRRASTRNRHNQKPVLPLPMGRRNKRGETPLHVAAIKGNLEIVRDLLKQGADPSAKDNAGWTPLHEACNHGHVAIAELLLDNGAMLDMTGGADHDTPLHDAVANGRLEIVKLLVARGAPLNVRNKQGILPKDYAVGDTMLDAFSQGPKSHKQSSSPVQPLAVNVTTTTHKVILATGLSAVQKEQLQKCVNRLGGSCVVREFSASVTHAVTVTNEGACKRTIKYLCCVLTGKWIVSFEWISKCLRSKRWVDETPFEACGTNEAKVEAPRRARQNALKQLPGLFDGCNFFFYGNFNPLRLSKDELIQMVKSGGGKILTREPKPDLDESLCLTTVPATVVYHARPDSDQYRRTHYVIFDPSSERRSRTCKYSNAVCFAPLNWLMDCISHFEIVDVPQG